MCAIFTILRVFSSLLALFLLCCFFHVRSSHAQVLGTRLVHECHISCSHIECFLRLVPQFKSERELSNERNLLFISLFVKILEIFEYFRMFLDLLCICYLLITNKVHLFFTCVCPQLQVLVQLHPPASCTSLHLHSEWGLLACGTAHGFALTDIANRRNLLAKSTLSSMG